MSGPEYWAKHMTVAASDAPAQWKLGARYVCDGAADEEFINAAIVDAFRNGEGGAVYLTPGTFNCTRSSPGGAVVMRGRVALLGSGKATELHATGVWTGGIGGDSGLICLDDSWFSNQWIIAHLSLHCENISMCSGVKANITDPFVNHADGFQGGEGEQDAAGLIYDLWIYQPEYGIHLDDKRPDTGAHTNNGDAQATKVNNVRIKQARRSGVRANVADNQWNLLDIGSSGNAAGGAGFEALRANQKITNCKFWETNRGGATKPWHGAGLFLADIDHVVAACIGQDNDSANLYITNGDTDDRVDGSAPVAKFAADCTIVGFGSHGGGAGGGNSVGAGIYLAANCHGINIVGHHRAAGSAQSGPRGWMFAGNLQACNIIGSASKLAGGTHVPVSAAQALHASTRVHIGIEDGTVYSEFSHWPDGATKARHNATEAFVTAGALQDVTQLAVTVLGGARYYEYELMFMYEGDPDDVCAFAVEINANGAGLGQLQAQYDYLHLVKAGTCAAGTAGVTVVAAVATFSADDVGREICFSTNVGAGRSSAVISAFTSSTTVTIEVASGQISGDTFVVLAPQRRHHNTSVTAGAAASPEIRPGMAEQLAVRAVRVKGLAFAGTTNATTTITPQVRRVAGTGSGIKPKENSYVKAVPFA